MPVQFDTNASAAALSDKGFTASRVAIVTGLVGASSGRLQVAINSLGAPIGAAHPSIAGLKLDNISAAFMDDSPNVAVCTMQYTPTEEEDDAPDAPAFTQISVGAAVTQETANTDVKGKVVEVQYTPPLKDDQTEPNTEQKQTGTFAMLIPNVTITARRMEQASPGATAKEFVGTVNSGTWSLDRSARRRTWLCTGIEGDSDDSGRTFNVTYSFQFQRQDMPGAFGAQRFGWDANVVFNDPATGRPPPGLPKATAAGHTGSSANKDVQIYTEMDFDRLNL